MNWLKYRLREWLEIKDPLLDQKALEKIAAENNKVLEAEISKVNGEIDHWKRIAENYSAIPCAHCEETMYVYPFGGAYYILPNQGKVHVKCYDDYLKAGTK